MFSDQSGKQSAWKTAPARAKAAGSAVKGIVGGTSSGDNSSGGAADSVDSRRLKKRELDRRCQRMARERTKQRIAYLEELVDNFRKQDASGQIANLMKQLTDIQKERDELAKTLKTIANSLRSNEVLNADASKSAGDEVKDEVLVNGSTALLRPANSVFLDALTPISNTQLLPADDSLTETAIKGSPEEGPWMLDDNFVQEPEEESADAVDLSSPEVPDPDPVYPKSKQSCACQNNASPVHQPSPNIWRYACETLSTRQRQPAEIMRIEDAYAEDIPVRAMLDGWDSVTAFYGGSLPPLWQKLRQIDEVVFNGMELKERLACIHVMHLLYSYHSDPTPERRKRLPAWYLKRPSQTMAHSYAIDFFAWPGIRERFVFSQHRYCSNVFWYLFNSGLHVLWPYEFRDCYFRNVTTGQYGISAPFNKRLYDINAWTMGDDMFKQWPELCSDFPSYNKFPMHINGGAGAFHKAPKRRTLPAPDSEIHSPVTVQCTSSESSQDEEVVLANSSSAAHALGSATTTQQTIFLGNVALTSNSFAPAANGLYSMLAVDDWWGIPLHFAPQQQQQEQPMATDLTFGAMGSRSDQVSRLDGLNF